MRGREIAVNTSVEPVVHLDAIDAAWLTQILGGAGALGHGGRVTCVELATCGTGQLADSYRFALTYDAPDSGPATLVGKFPSEDLTSRAFGKQSGYSRTEIASTRKSRRR